MDSSVICSAVNPVASFGNASPRVQAHVDTEGQELPYSVHFAHVSVGLFSGGPDAVVPSKPTIYGQISPTSSLFASHSTRLAFRLISCRT